MNAHSDKFNRKVVLPKTNLMEGERIPTNIPIAAYKFHNTSEHNFN